MATRKEVLEKMNAFAADVIPFMDLAISLADVVEDMIAGRTPVKSFAVEKERLVAARASLRSALDEFDAEFGE